MSTLLSPELVLVLPESQRAAAIRALPTPPVWNPGPLGPALRAARRPVLQVLVATALAYFVVRLLWTLTTAAVYVVVFVGMVIVLTLIF
jgi:hypothetical protein